MLSEIVETKSLYNFHFLLLSMSETLDKLTIKLCEGLPLDFTLYERNGFCQKYNEDCNYCKKKEDDLYFCNKKTYNHNSELRFI
jgi:predicted proteasome-type protease